MGVQLDGAVKEAFDVAYIYAFHAAQRTPERIAENMKGAQCKRVARSINSVGLLCSRGNCCIIINSSALMLSVVSEFLHIFLGYRTVVLATPPSQDGTIYIMQDCKKAGVTYILKAGGAQAIAPMAWGTETCPNSLVNPIVDDVRTRGDAAVKEYTWKFEKAKLDKAVKIVSELPVPALDGAVKEALDVAYSNIYAFHAAKKTPERIVENMKCFIFRNTWKIYPGSSHMSIIAPDLWIFTIMSINSVVRCESGDASEAMENGVMPSQGVIPNSSSARWFNPPGLTLNPIVEDVRKRDDAAVKEFAKLDKVVEIVLELPDPVLDGAVKEAFDVAYSNIYAFHAAQKIPERIVVNMKGVQCMRVARSISSVGLNVPGGTAGLPSTARMLSVVTCTYLGGGFKTIVLATPPSQMGTICKAIAAMAWVIETCPKVEKIFGPGNQYVTAAKMIPQENEVMVAIDMAAVPSEVLVIADKHAIPRHVVADLLSQAEHGPDSQVVLVIAGEGVNVNALTHSLLLKPSPTSINFSNLYAPKHLIVNVEDFIENAGSVFLGPWSPESVGDYASGTNHVLPTYGYARMYSGVSLDSFLKYIMKSYRLLELSDSELQSLKARPRMDFSSVFAVGDCCITINSFDALCSCTYFWDVKLLFLQLATPPSQDGTTCKALYCAKKTGITRILKAGGAQSLSDPMMLGQPSIKDMVS
ncbi:hypothetical protein PIB30_020780 [Stylosanthes scabra]|uniref:Histidinol dehydrogenase n=1 Tax=Stylosanthes scabra TaxID=79078 RepID=A0ABU6R8Y0_9FABA|nr:hypothetical protein [Stylosanthes scabra]